ncbi:FMN-binding protein [Couchioplanes caeruleus]|uniref:FMN-binding protein n=1 Tax=Couchioplanes caeruleus TaxID=56438 RepID=UPI00201C2F5D|nr:FMN-binding protein [Couchioplanes caeruleus]UQU61761.1 FMN-binding protein [Couchioplanes caeruleus]
MRRLTLWIVSTIAAVVLLLSYRTSLGGPAPSAAAGAAAPGIVPAPAPSGGSAPARRAKTVTANGTVARTRWGPVQVQVTITDGKITGARALRHPTGSDRDDEINGYALPRLRAEVLQAQSAHIDAVSGATVTSGGYAESLQSALDAAHFG